jgi:hypothetical protein
MIHFLFRCFFACCARFVVLLHVLLFHDAGTAYCISEPDCPGHLVCHKCELLIWDCANDPWHPSDDEARSDDDIMFS